MVGRWRYGALHLTREHNSIWVHHMVCCSVGWGTDLSPSALLNGICKIAGIQWTSIDNEQHTYVCVNNIHTLSMFKSIPHGEATSTIKCLHLVMCVKYLWVMGKTSYFSYLEQIFRSLPVYIVYTSTIDSAKIYQTSWEHSYVHT